MAENNYSIRPQFHITGEKGWINDPNGLISFNGEYHVFFQYHPQGLKWGPMHWGHVKSKDLFAWERLPNALTPDEQDDGCFSGSAVVWQNKLWLMYTSFKENGGGENVRQLQAVASSLDGVNFVKHGIVIGEKDLPEEYSACDFRDPQIFNEDGKLYCLVAARKKDGRGRIVMFTSNDMFNWKFCCDILNKDSSGIMIECPYYFKQLGILIYCEQFQKREGDKHLNIYSTYYHLGKLNCKTLTNTFSESEIIDYGFDFYAPQIFPEMPIMIGWLNMWGRNIPYDTNGFAGMLTVLRKLSIKSGRLWQEPLYKGEKVREEKSLTIEDNVAVGVIEIEVENLVELQLKLRASKEEESVVTCTPTKLIFDRSKSGKPFTGDETDPYSLSGKRVMPLDNITTHKIVIVLDYFSVEIFADGRALSSAICPSPDSTALHLITTANSCKYTRYTIPLMQIKN